MRVGYEIKSLFNAFGTTFDEVGRNVKCQNGNKHSGNHAEDHLQLNGGKGFSYPRPIYKEDHISRLVGYEGLLFRISRFSSGIILVSVFGDHGTRIWEVQVKKGISSNAAQEQVNKSVCLILFRHKARIWDFYICESLFITIGEVGTCRVGDQHGRELNKIRELIGRGVWRCSYDFVSSLLVILGLDSPIKLHLLHFSLEELVTTFKAENFCDKIEAFAILIQNPLGYGGLKNSKTAEYASCCVVQEQVHESLIITFEYAPCCGKRTMLLDASFEEELRLYVGKLYAETSMLQDSFEVVEAGCSKLLRQRRSFELLEAVHIIEGMKPAPIKIEEPKHRTERVFRVFKRISQLFVALEIRIPNLEVKVYFGRDDLIRENEDWSLNRY